MNKNKIILPETDSLKSLLPPLSSDNLKSAVDTERNAMVSERFLDYTAALDKLANFGEASLSTEEDGFVRQVAIVGLLDPSYGRLQDKFGVCMKCFRDFVAKHPRGLSQDEADTISENSGINSTPNLKAAADLHYFLTGQRRNFTTKTQEKK